MRPPPLLGFSPRQQKPTSIPLHGPFGWSGYFYFSIFLGFPLSLPSSFLLARKGFLGDTPPYNTQPSIARVAPSNHMTIRPLLRRAVLRFFLGHCPIYSNSPVLRVMGDAISFHEQRKPERSLLTNYGTCVRRRRRKHKTTNACSSLGLMSASALLRFWVFFFSLPLRRQRHNSGITTFDTFPFFSFELSASWGWTACFAPLDWTPIMALHPPPLSRAEKGSRSRKHHLVASPLPRNAARFFLLGRWGGRHWSVDGKDSLVVVGIVSREMEPADMEGRWRRNTERGDFHFIKRRKLGIRTWRRPTLALQDQRSPDIDARPCAAIVSRLGAPEDDGSAWLRRVGVRPWLSYTGAVLITLFSRL